MHLKFAVIGRGNKFHKKQYRMNRKADCWDNAVADSFSKP